MSRPWSDALGDEGFRLLDMLNTHLEHAITEGLDDAASEEWVRACARLAELLPAPIPARVFRRA